MAGHGHGTAGRSLVWATQRAEGREPFGLHNQHLPKAPGLANMARNGMAQSTLALMLGSLHRRHGTAGKARLARHGWHGTTHILGTAGTIILARILLLAQQGTARHAATLTDICIYIYVLCCEESFVWKGLTQDNA